MSQQNQNDVLDDEYMFEKRKINKSILELFNLYYIGNQEKNPSKYSHLKIVKYIMYNLAKVFKNGYDVSCIYDKEHNMIISDGDKFTRVKSGEVFTVYGYTKRTKRFDLYKGTVDIRANEFTESRKKLLDTKKYKRTYSVVDDYKTTFYDRHFKRYRSNMLVVSK